jgi:hypothetical protein
LFLFSQNAGLVIVSQVWLALGAALAAATACFALAYVAVRSVAKAAAITAVLVLAFFSYGHVYHLLEVQAALRIALPYVYAAVMLIAIVAVLRAKNAGTFARPIPYLNIVAAVLILLSLIPIATYLLRGWSAAHSVRASGPDAQNQPRLLDSPQRPDIYYIIMDAYSSNDHLMRGWGYDNSSFTDALEDRGFFVAYDSKTTYGATIVSLAASLNMRYFDDADKTAAASMPADRDYFSHLITDNEVARQLQSRGYTYVFMVSGFMGSSTIADTNTDFYPSGPRYFTAASRRETQDEKLFYEQPFTPLLLETTALRSYAETSATAQEPEGKPITFWKPEKTLMTWAEAEKIPAMPAATFTIIHILKPHEPLAFRRDGSLIPYPYVRYAQPHAEVEAAFFDQLEYVNERTLQMLDAIIAGSDVPPIIILQGDHGTVLGKPDSVDGHRTNFAIMNAYRIPQHPDCITDRSIIPINSFRALLNCSFGTDYPMLDAHYYAMPEGYDNLFDFVEIDIDAWEAEFEKP